MGRILWVGLLVLVLYWGTIHAADFFVIPAGKKATGNATRVDVLKGKTFSNSSDVGLTGTRAPAPVEKTGSNQQLLSGDDGDLQQGVPWPDPRFQAGQHVVTDNLTGLTWQRTPNTQGTSWYSAIPYCNTLVILEPAGNFVIKYDDWRLANVKELQSLIDYGNHNPALPDYHPFLGSYTYPYWSSTTRLVDSGDYIYAWTVSFYNGDLSSDYKSTNYYNVWCVHGGN